MLNESLNKFLNSNESMASVAKRGVWTMSREQMISKRKRSAQVLQQKVMLIIAAIALIILCSSVFGGLLTSAHGSRSEEPVNYKYYKSIEIESGDTLWSIAETYMTDEYSSVGDYVEELKSINSLSSEEIHEDQYLTVAYYDTQFKK